MGERASIGSEIKVGALRGINLRKSRSQLDSGESDRNFGLYPSATGQLSRIPGKELLRVFEDGSTPRPVYQVYQAFDGTGNMIVQNGDAIGVYSLDELFNRTPEYSLTPTAAAGGYILLGHTQNAGVSGGPLHSVSETDAAFYLRTINTLFSDSGGYVQSLANNSFTLPTGTYRIIARVATGSLIGIYPMQAKCGLYSVTNNTFKTYYNSSTEIIGTASVYSAGVSSTDYMFIMGRFAVTAASETFGIAMSLTSPGNPDQGATNNSQGSPSNVASKSETYCIINLTTE